MEIKEKCIYYNNARNTYYLVLSAKKEDGLIMVDVEKFKSKSSWCLYNRKAILMGLYLKLVM